MVSWKEENVLTGFLFLSIVCHGMFFAREWIILGIIFILCWMYYRLRAVNHQQLIKAFKMLAENNTLMQPIGIFMLLIILSLAGLFNPIRMSEGWLEAFRWLILLIAFLWGRRYAIDDQIRDRILNSIILIAILSTILTWVPGSEWIWVPAGSPEAGRFGASFGYPNAAAVFLGSIILLLLKDKEARVIHLLVAVISVICTGSRAGVSLLLFFCPVLFLKKTILRIREKKAAQSDNILSFYTGSAWSGPKESKYHTVIMRTFALVSLGLIMQQTILRYNGSLLHLLDWTNTSLGERTVYYLDSFKLARVAHFLPQAGGWLAFPFIQTTPYWTLDPHSSFCRILLNQGLGGVIILGIWSLKGLINYLTDIIKSSDLTQICIKTAAVYLAAHSLVDVDMAFGSLGILFWLLVGMSSK